MKEYFKIVRHLFPTFLAVCLGSTVSLLLLRWLVSIQWQLIALKVEVFELWIPLGAPIIPLLLWLRPKLEIIEFKNSRADRFIFHFLAGLTIVGTSIASNKYITNSLGGMSVIDSSAQLETVDTKYIKIDSIQLDKSAGSASVDFSYSGKHNEYLDMNLFFVYPFATTSDSLKGKYWYSEKYHLRISAESSEEKRQEEYQQFFERSSMDFFEHDPGIFNYYQIIPFSDDSKHYLKATQESPQASANYEDPVVIEGLEGDYKERSGNFLFWAILFLFIGSFIFLIALLFPSLNQTEYDRQKRGLSASPNSDLQAVTEFLIPRGDHFVTTILMYLNVIVFVIMILSGVHIMSPSADSLLHWGGNIRSETLNGEWWRLISCVFLHSGIMHLALNMYGLFLGAMVLEPRLGRLKFSLVYLFSGVFASMASLYWHENTVSVGASGAIFGLFGAILGLLMTNIFPQKELKKSILALVAPFVGINLVYGFAESGVDNAAHIGGLISGFLIGLILYLSDKRKSEEH